MADDLPSRVRALERAVSDQTDPPAPIPTLADATTRQAELAARLDDLEMRVDNLHARQAAVEAYVDRIDHVNDAIERRADAALAAVDRLERATDDDPANAATRAADSPQTAGTEERVADAAARTDDAEPDADEAGFVERLLGP